jgi:hypothetical protein
LLAAAVVLTAALAAVAVAAAGGFDGGTDGPLRAQLIIERSVLPTTGQPELLVSLPDQRLNSLETTGGETGVLLGCADEAGAVTIRQQHEWPLLEEEGFPPHVHQPAAAQQLDSVRSCRLTGNGIDFAGHLSPAR